jgi:hypothetical protein
MALCLSSVGDIMKRSRVTAWKGFVWMLSWSYANTCRCKGIVLAGIIFALTDSETMYFIFLACNQIAARVERVRSPQLHSKLSWKPCFATSILAVMRAHIDLLVRIMACGMTTKSLKFDFSRKVKDIHRKLQQLVRRNSYLKKKIVFTNFSKCWKGQRQWPLLPLDM